MLFTVVRDKRETWDFTLFTQSVCTFYKFIHFIAHRTFVPMICTKSNGTSGIYIISESRNIFGVEWTSIIGALLITCFEKTLLSTFKYLIFYYLCVKTVRGLADDSSTSSHIPPKFRFTTQHSIIGGAKVPSLRTVKPLWSHLKIVFENIRR